MKIWVLHKHQTPWISQKFESIMIAQVNKKIIFKQNSSLPDIRYLLDISWNFSNTIQYPTKLAKYCLERGCFVNLEFQTLRSCHCYENSDELYSTWIPKALPNTKKVEPDIPSRGKNSCVR